MKKDKFDYLIALASIGCGQDDVEMFKNLDTSDVVFDQSFYRIRDRRIRRYKRAPFVKSLKNAMTRIAVVVLAILSAGTVAVAAIPSLREAVFGAIVEWYEDYLTINYEIPEDEPYESGGTAEEADETDKTETEATADDNPERPTKIEQVKKPTYYQEGLVEDIVVESRAQISIDYYLGDDLLYSFKQLVFTENNMYVNNESALVQSIKINENEAYFVELIDSSHKKIIWTDGLYTYQLSTDLCDLEMFIMVAESVE